MTGCNTEKPLPEEPIEKEPVNSEPEKKLCPPNSKNVDACTADYNPVCGWFNQNIKCIKFPCAANFPNSCNACKDSKVESYTVGECPI